jgi:hypothetical protein
MGSVAVVISLDDTKAPWKYIGAELPPHSKL